MREAHQAPARVRGRVEPPAPQAVVRKGGTHRGDPSFPVDRPGRAAAGTLVPSGSGSSYCRHYPVGPDHQHKAYRPVTAEVWAFPRFSEAGEPDRWRGTAPRA
ncbi:hypothetical protein Stsp01_55180 [Streptomyces sp. NBRC 13847]|nr:hypothetical protein Stsp01_55180 [Streptomyces sp. NBRC 13847]